MHPLLLPGIAFAGGVAALLSAKEAEVNAPPVASLLVAGRAPDGSAIRSFKLDVQSIIMQALDESGLEVDPTEGSGKVVFKVTDRRPGELSAAQVVTAAHAEKLVVLASLSLADVTSKEKLYVVLCDPSERRLASPSGQLAILFDVPHAPKQLVAPPPPPSRFDANLPANVVTVVERSLVEGTNTEELRRMADVLEAESYPVSAAAIRARAKAMDLERMLLGAPPPQVGVAKPETIPEPETPVEEQEPAPLVELAEAEPASAEAAVAIPVECKVEEAPPMHLNGLAKIPFTPAENVTAEATA